MGELLSGHTPIEVSRRTRATRMVAEKITAPLLPRRIVDPDHNLERVEQAVREGQGIVAVFTHFSEGDGPRFSRTVFRNATLRRKEVLYPIALHHDNRALSKFSDLLGTPLAPIPTGNTFEAPGYENLRTKEGLVYARSLKESYMEKCKEILSGGGIVTVAEQGERAGQMDMNSTKNPVRTLIKEMNKRNVTEYGILPVAFGLKKTTTYDPEQVGGLNIGRKYQVFLGEYVPLEDLLEEVVGDLGKVDHAVRERLAAIAPLAYLPDGHPRKTSP